MLIEYAVLVVAIFIVISSVVLGFALYPWLFLLLFLLVPLGAVMLRRNMSLPGEIEGQVTPSMAASWASIGVLILVILFIGIPSIWLGIWLHPFFFLILLLFSGLVAVPTWISLRRNVEENQAKQ